MTFANYGSLANIRIAMEQTQKENERTQLRKNLVEILEDSKSDLARILLMERMGSFTGNNNIKYLTDIKKVNEQTTLIQRSIISDILTTEVQKANEDIKSSGGYVHYGMIMLGGQAARGYDGIYLLDTIKYQFVKYNKEELDRFYTMWEDLKKEALQTSLTLKEKRDTHMNGWKKCLGELARQDFIIDKDAVKYKWGSSNKYDHIDTLQVYYEDKIVADRSINLLADIPDIDAYWEKSAKQLIDTVYKNCIKERKSTIDTQIKEMCHSFGFGETNFVLLKNTTKPWSFEGNSYISASIDFSKPDIYADFRKELRNAIATIIYMTEKCQENPGKLNISVGDAYRFKYLGEKGFEGHSYIIYESKIGKDKALLQIFKDGKRLWGRGRIKALRLLEMGRNGKSAQNVLQASL